MGNVFKVMKIIWKKQGLELDTNLPKHSLLLLAMAAADETKFQMQKLFNSMEIRSPDIINEVEPTNLKELLFHLLDSDEFRDHILFEGLDTYTIKSKKDWYRISIKFQLARSFSFFRTLNDENKTTNNMMEATNDKKKKTKII